MSLPPVAELTAFQSGGNSISVIINTDALAKFSKTELVIRQGGNHSYDGYAGELPAIEAFLLSRIAESVR